MLTRSQFGDARRARFQRLPIQLDTGILRFHCEDQGHGSLDQLGAHLARRALLSETNFRNVVLVAFGGQLDLEFDTQR